MNYCKYKITVTISDGSKRADNSLINTASCTIYAYTTFPYSIIYDENLIKPIISK